VAFLEKETKAQKSTHCRIPQSFNLCRKSKLKNVTKPLKNRTANEIQVQLLTQIICDHLALMMPHWWWDDTADTADIDR